MKLGVDLGTTNCTVGRIRADGKHAVVGPIPSIIAWSNGEMFFGDKARELLRSEDPTVHPVRDLKLALGVNDIRIGAHQHSSTNLAAALLKDLFRRSGAEEVEELVIATPVKMPRSHRIALQAAAEIAGVGKTRLVYEPTAALIGASRFVEHGQRDLILVVDWGGGTLDATVVQQIDGSFRELISTGDCSSLGGTHIDTVLTDKVIQSSKIREKVERMDGGFERLKEEVEELKIELNVLEFSFSNLFDEFWGKRFLSQNFFTTSVAAQSLRRISV